jgi:hypothetical protein
MKVSEFCGELTEVYVEIFDANDEKVYSDLHQKFQHKLR